MVLSLGFVNSTGVVVIVSHDPDTSRCLAHTQAGFAVLVRTLCGLTLVTWWLALT